METPSTLTTTAAPILIRRELCLTCTIPIGRSMSRIKARAASGQEFAEAFRDKLISSKDGTGIYFLSAAITSPTLARQWQEVQKAYPKAKLVQYEPAIAGTFLEKAA